MNSRIESAGLSIDPLLYQLINEEVLPETGISAEAFWQGLAGIVEELGPKNRSLLACRNEIQQSLDDWHGLNPGLPDLPAYKDFLAEIGYLVQEEGDFQIRTTNVDPEIASIAGPQLVVPVSNARFALNAANARWGSLYDAFYGTDVIPETDGCEKGDRFNPKRGEKVIARAADFLDRVFPLTTGSHLDVSAYEIDRSVNPAILRVTLIGGVQTELVREEQFAGFILGDEGLVILLKNNLWNLN